MARLPRRTAHTTIALGLLVFLPAIAPRASALWGRATVVNASGTATINHDRSTLIIGSQYGDPQNLDPIATFLLSWGMMGSNIFDALVYRGPDLKIHKDTGLATGWRYLNDNTLRCGRVLEVAVPLIGDIHWALKPVRPHLLARKEQ